MTPEKLHLALNHLPFLACVFGILPLTFGLLLRQRLLLHCGFALIGLGVLALPLVMESGEEAYDRYKKGPVTPYLDAGAYEALETHEHMAEDLAKIFIVTGVLSLTGLAFGFAKPAISRKIAMATLVMCVVSAVVGVRISDSGGKIRRPDFRRDTGTALQSAERSHDDD